MQFYFPRRTAQVTSYKKINWRTVVIDSIESQFMAVAEQAKQAGHGENLYVHRNDEVSSIQLFFGQHPVGIMPGTNTAAIEKGAALVVSQGVTGSVAVFLYPYESELSRRREKLIVWAFYDDPVDITKRVVQAMIADFLCYTRVSSVTDGGTASDRKRIAKLLKRSRYQSEVEVTAAALEKQKRRLAQEEARERSLQQKAERRHAEPSKLGAFFANHPVIVGIAVVSGIMTIVASWDPVIDKMSSVLGTPGQVRAPGMPVISGWYTICEDDDSGASAEMRKLLSDIEQNAGKVAFFDVQVNINCEIAATGDRDAPFLRTEEGRSLVYRFNPDGRDIGRSAGGHTDGLPTLPDNGAIISVVDDSDGRNAMTRLEANAEGTNDVIYGPYLVKARSDDATLLLDLRAPLLDTTMQESAELIAKQRKAATAKENSLPKRLPKPISISPADERRFREQASSAEAPTTIPKHRPPPPNPTSGSLPPLPSPNPVSGDLSRVEKGR